jgi:hypothetical protein
VRHHLLKLKFSESSHADWHLSMLLADLWIERGSVLRRFIVEPIVG